MVSKAGHIFHIDFGHFLGNFNSKFGVRRERTPFVFTTKIKYAIDGGDRNSKVWNGFYEWCYEAYNVLRSLARLLLMLFALMVSDIVYFQHKLKLNYDIKKAREHLKKLIKSSVSDRARIIDNAMHGSGKKIKMINMKHLVRAKKCLDPTNKSHTR